MPSKYKRKTEKQSNDETVIRALKAIDSGMSVRKAAREFGLAEPILRRHNKNNRQSTNINQLENMEVDNNLESVASTSTAEPALPTEAETQTQAHAHAQATPIA